MTLKVKVLLSLLALLLAFAVGRRSISQGSKQTTEKQVETTTAQDIKKTIVVVKDPSGKTTTTLTEDIQTRTDLKTDQIKSNTTGFTRKALNVSALAGTSLSTFKPVYGVSVSREFIGPVTVGLYGMTDGMIGLSLGINF